MLSPAEQQGPLSVPSFLAGFQVIKFGSFPALPTHLPDETAPLLQIPGIELSENQIII